MALRRRKYRVKLPAGPFTLVHEDDPDPAMFEGPWDPRWAEEDADGSVTLGSDGLPVVLRVTKQDGNLVTLEDGTKMRFQLRDERDE